MRIELQNVTKGRRATFAALALILAGAAIASTAALGQTVTRAARGEPGKDIRVGVFVNVKQDCSSGPLPTIRLVEKPANGTVTVKSAQDQREELQAMPRAGGSGLRGVLQVGADLQRRGQLRDRGPYPEGRTEMQKLNVTVGAGQKEQKI